MDRTWPNRPDWESLKSGIGCPLCATAPDVDDHGFTVARLQASVLRLGRNQFSTGYCVLVCDEHGPEPYSLAPDRSAAYLQDMVQSAAALERAFGADKLNFLTLGNAVPHLHTHLIPRYLGDPAPGAPLLPENVPEIYLNDDEYRERVSAIRRELHIE
jgi:diadenosine tetraphosphate (Ap4A) HIT family hydrolase